MTLASLQPGETYGDLGSGGGIDCFIVAKKVGPTGKVIGQGATYLGPGKAFIDEEGHQFPRNGAVEVCTDTAAKLSADPYAASFSLFDSSLPPDQQIYSCDPKKGCC